MKITGNEQYKYLTIRQHIATAAMQGFLSNPYATTQEDGKIQTYQSYAKMSVLAADALISELNKDK